MFRRPCQISIPSLHSLALPYLPLTNPILPSPFSFTPYTNISHNNPQDPDVYGEKQETAEEQIGSEGAEAEELEVIGGVEPEGLGGLVGCGRVGGTKGNGGGMEGGEGRGKELGGNKEIRKWEGLDLLARRSIGLRLSGRASGKREERSRGDRRG